MKPCFKCGRTLELSEFYPHSRMADGHLNKCKACTRRDTQENRDRNRDYYVEYDRQRSTADRVARMEAQRNPIKHRARRAVHAELAAGRMHRQPCEVCGALRVDAHHADYSQPLNVRWLCRKHHGEVHRMENTNARS